MSRSLQVFYTLYRGHEGTVYSLDVNWKNGQGPRSPYSASRKTTPYDADSETVVLVTGQSFNNLGSHDQTIAVWDVQTTEKGKGDISVKVDQTKRLKGHGGDVYAIELFRDENVRRYGTMISGGDYSLRSWKSEPGTVNQTFHGHTGYVSCLKVHGRRAFSGSWDTTVRSWNLDVYTF